MKFFVVVVLLQFPFATVVFGLPPASKLHAELPSVNKASEDPGAPLFLSPYILSGKADQARDMARVDPMLPDMESYSGYITVDNTTGANMFFWGIATQRNQQQAPVILWLQGGPGASSMFGLFVENGPLKVDENMQVSHRPTAWTNMYHMLYIDNPVGTGFSFVRNESGLRTDEDGVADHLYTFFVQFYMMFPQLHGQPLYVSGESYAGKYVPAIAKKLVEMERMHLEQGTTYPIAKLAGIMIGNGLTDPETMFPPSGDHLFNLGLLNYPQMMYFNNQTNLAVQHIHKKEFKAAFDIFDMLINGDFYPYPSFFANASGCTDYFNFIQCNQSLPEFGYYVDFLKMNETRRKIHVGSQPYGDQSSKVEAALINDVMDTVKPRVEYLLNHTSIPILYYSGNLDLIVPTPGTDNFLRHLYWAHGDDWMKAKRKVWAAKDGNALAYSTTVEQLTFAIIRDAGHMVPFDQPQVTLLMIMKFLGDL